jgi:hypothetical protein
MRLVPGTGSRMLAMLLWTLLADASRADEPNLQNANSPGWPQKVVVTVGDLRTRIDGPKLWTLSGIDYQGAVMATEESAYGSVLIIRNVGHLGTAHFLDVPGKPGEVEKEQVTSLRFLVDGQPVAKFAPTMNLVGKSFRMERKSTIRSIELESSVAIADDVLVETASFRATGPIDLRVAYPWMYALSAEAKNYVFGDDEGIRQRGTFLLEGKTVSQVIRNANWMAVFDPASGKGSVCCFLKHPPATEGSFLLIDAPGVYRKVAGYTLVDTVVRDGFTGTYQAGVGFFNATESDWEERARRRVAEVKTMRVER